MKLVCLLGDQNLPVEFANVEVSGVSLNSRSVKKNFLFGALKGRITDGRKFIPDAIKKGASIILTHLEEYIPTSKTKYNISGLPGCILQKTGKTLYLYSPEPRALLAKIAAYYYQGQPEIITAVTGTNGKTSTVEFLRQIWVMAGYNAASIGTLGVQSRKISQSLSHTTPDAISLHKILADLTTSKVTHLAFEASSHGLLQHRLDQVKLSATGFTNLTQDHFDYHPDIEHYFSAKSILFESLSPSTAPSVICIDGIWGQRLAEKLKKENHKVFTIGWSGYDIKIHEVFPSPSSQTVSYVYQGKQEKLKLPLVGEFQVLNAFLAAGLAISLGMEAEQVFSYIEKLSGVPGRLEKVGETKEGANVFVDYAHTPDGLDKVLRALRPHTYGRLFVLFGCGGNRDKDKRPKMGAIAAKLADKVFITDDNPRYEIAGNIRKEILSSSPNAEEIPDRKKAILQAISLLEKEDALVIAGKGHEITQIIGEKAYPFSDFKIVRQALNQKKVVKQEIMTSSENHQ